MRKTLKKIAATFTAAALALAVTATAVPAPASADVHKQAKKLAKADFDPDGSYHAYFGFQETGTWIFRDEWYSDTLGTKGKDLKKAGLDYTGGTLFQSGTDGVTTIDGTTVTDAEITGNGTYTVGVSGINGSLDGDSETKVSMIYVTTDIPWTAQDNPVTISDWKLTIDGREQSLPDDIFFPSEYIDEAGFIRFDALNSYQKDKGEYEESPDLTSYPQDSIEITFTVSGFNSDNPDAVASTEEETSTGDDASTTTTSDGTTTASSSAKNTSPVGGIIFVLVIVAIVVVVVVRKKQ